jgi:hypothetical protein
MTTNLKDNSKHSAMELLFSTSSVLEVEEKLVEDEPEIKDNMERDEDGMRNTWDQGSWQRANIEGNNVMMISLHGGRTFQEY